ncbi:MAG: TonB-dependent receptor [Lysobacterales bacterium]
MLQKPKNLQAVLSACALSLSPTFPALAQESSDEPLEEIVVRAHPLSAEQFAQPVSILSGSRLDRARAPSVAETLVGIPGVHSSSFGQAVGRPILRGLGGARVKVTEDRIDSLDVSVSSPDHLTTIEPFSAQSIEVLKGPSTLLYGTGAIGGVVNVHTGRIPHEVPDTLSGKVELRAADNASQQTAAAQLNGGAGSFAFHVDAFYRDADEYDIPGFAESAGLRALEALEESDDEGEEEEEAFGTLPGSQLETRGGALGLSYVGERGFVGLAVSSYEGEYGLPGGHEHEHEEGEEEEGEEEEEEEEGNPILDLSQTRIDVEAGLDRPFAGFSSANFRLGFNDYEHTEFEGNGEAGTVFATEAMEGRVELVHEPFLGFDGATGVQFSTREFSALGEEAFVPPVDTDTVGIFYVGQRTFGRTGVDLGVRYEHVEQTPTVGRSRSFDLGAASIGLIQPLSDHWRITGQLDYSNRAPVAEELYSDGPHLATQSYEIGDPNLNEENALNVGGSIVYERETLSVSVSAYQTSFSDFIYEVATGEELDDLPVLQWRQQDATFRGLEADLGWNAMSWSNGGMALNVGYDRVRARLDAGENRNLPRIPPSRWRVGTVLSWGGSLAEFSWSRVSSQNDAALNELPTDSYNDFRVHFSTHLTVAGSDVELFVTGRNLTDDEQRYHTSFIKDFAPQPGRTIEAGVTVRL